MVVDEAISQCRVEWNAGHPQSQLASDDEADAVSQVLYNVQVPSSLAVTDFITSQMASSIALIEEVAAVAAAAFKQDEEGRVLFGFCGRSPEPLPVDAAVHSP